MQRNFLPWVLACLCPLAILPNRAQAQDSGKQIILPAGTLLNCTVSEPNFSSKTAKVGDPVVCALGGVRLFDRTVLPRGAYMGGHLEADKEPGRLVGKGYLKLNFDHIGLPDDQVPVPTKIIAASGYRVDREGRIIGHGHATRDMVEWMIPPLWPAKALRLPARGPRPTLKGEARLTLRLMDDAAVPDELPSGWHHFGKPSSEIQWPDGNLAVPSRDVTPDRQASVAPTLSSNSPVATSARAASAPGQDTGQSMLVLRNGAAFRASSLRLEGDRFRLDYRRVDGGCGAVSLDDVDWAKTFQSNAENGTMLALTSASPMY
jgi:hypothetical protein